LASFHFFSSSLLVVAVTFVASCFLGLSFPAINSIYADMIAARPKQETDIEGLEDFSFNLSYFFGPLLAGVLADVFSISLAFTFLGSFGILIALFLWFSAYRKKK
jgi:predicted MFS family arabinose efflux permease